MFKIYKMKKLLNLFFIVIRIADAQPNLVPNYSFENYSACPVAGGQIGNAYPWFQPYFGVGFSSTDYYNACNNTINGALGVPMNLGGYSAANTGFAYAGITTFSAGADNREYLEIQLIDSLQMSQNYCLSFYISLADGFKYGTDAIGIYLSHDSVTYISPPYGVLSLNPQVENTIGNIITDTNTWYLFKQNFTANGGEKYITIGNFKHDSTTNFQSVNPAGQSYAYYYIDDISVVQGQCTVGLEEPEHKREISVYPNPVKDVCLITAKQFTNAVLSVYDITGRVVLTEDFSKYFQLNTALLTSGLYIVEIKNKQGSSIKTKLIKE